MTQRSSLISALKRLLKERHITYRMLADDLELSESAVKRMFATGNMSLVRLEEVCERVGCELADLVAHMARDARLEELPIDDEQALVDDPMLLLVAYCMVNHWTLDTVRERYRVSESDLVRCLARLDRMKLIELLPDNRVRTLVGNSFRWQPNGPIERFFRSQVQDQFFASAFAGVTDLHLVKMADLSRAAQDRIRQRVRAIGQLFDEIAEEERRVSSTERHGMTLVLAMREWRYEAFARFERHSD
ncbi:MAG: helix-turn-helix transcriptional regulator [Pseudomonadota bacterium]